MILRLRRKFLLIVFIYVNGVFSVIYSQYYRLAGLGGLFIGVEDVDNGLNLYDFGKNPAWVAVDERTDKTWLDFHFSTFYGDYKRLYDPKSLSLYEINLVRVKDLNRVGTFKGYAIYKVEERRDVYRSLLLYPYNGRAFFVVDTTVGSFRYTGPEVAFEYGVEVIKNIFVGARFNYRIIDGLKNVYTRARTIYRSLDWDLGLAIKFSERGGIGVKINLIDSQEKIEAKSEDLYDAEVYLFRGNTYAIRRVSNIVNLKLKESGYGGDIHGNFILNRFKFAFNVKYKQKGEYILIPYGLLEEYEFGYTNFEDYVGEVMCRINVSKFALVGLFARYEYVDMWSRHSPRNLLLWHEKFKFIRAGAGLWFRISEKLPSFGFEFIYGVSGVDSMKYIDNIFVKIGAFDYNFKGGMEYSLGKNIVIRTGVNYGFLKRDILTGCDNVNYYEISFGVDIFDKLGFVFRFGEKFNGCLSYFLSYGSRRVFSSGSVILKLS